MRLLLILPRVEPEEIIPPCECPYEGCGGTHLQFIQEVKKPLRDTKYPQVLAHRYRCLRCFRTLCWLLVSSAWDIYPRSCTSR